MNEEIKEEVISKESNSMDLQDLMIGIALSMQITREKQKEIEQKETELREEVAIVKASEIKEQIRNLKQSKREFDDMTTNSLINVKKQIILMRNETEKRYQDMLLKTAQKRRQINETLNKLRINLADKPEKLQLAEQSATDALQNVNAKMKEFQDTHFEKRTQLDKCEKMISEYAIELGVEEKITKAEADQEKIAQMREEMLQQTTPQQTSESQENAQPVVEPKAEPKASTVVTRQAKPQQAPTNTANPQRARTLTSVTSQIERPRIARRGAISEILIDIDRYGTSSFIRRNIENEEEKEGPLTPLTEDKETLEGISTSLKDNAQIGDKWIIRELRTLANPPHELISKAEAGEEISKYLTALATKDPEERQSVIDTMRLDIKYDLRGLNLSPLDREQKKEFKNNAKMAKDLGIAQVEAGLLTKLQWKISDILAKAKQKMQYLLPQSTKIEKLIEGNEAENDETEKVPEEQEKQNVENKTEKTDKFGNRTTRTDEEIQADNANQSAQKEQKNKSQSDTQR